MTEVYSFLLWMALGAPMMWAAHRYVWRRDYLLFTGVVIGMTLSAVMRYLPPAFGWEQ